MDADVCPISLSIESNFDIQAGEEYPNLEVYDETEVCFDVFKNSQIQLNDGTNCNLGLLNTHECDVNWHVNVNSVNGTMAQQATGTITVKSECFLLDSEDFKNNQID